MLMLLDQMLLLQSVVLCESDEINFALPVQIQAAGHCDPMHLQRSTWIVEICRIPFLETFNCEL